mgnify:CR=1 FL=1
MSWSNWRSARKRTSLVCRPLRDQATRLRQEEIRRLEEELNAAEAALFLDPAGDRHASGQDGPGTRFLG